MPLTISKSLIQDANQTLAYHFDKVKTGLSKDKFAITRSNVSDSMDYAKSLRKLIKVLKNKYSLDTNLMIEDISISENNVSFTVSHD